MRKKLINIDIELTTLLDCVREIQRSKTSLNYINAKFLYEQFKDVYYNGEYNTIEKYYFIKKFVDYFECEIVEDRDESLKQYRNDELYKIIYILMTYILKGSYIINNSIYRYFYSNIDDEKIVLNTKDEILKSNKFINELSHESLTQLMDLTKYAVSKTNELVPNLLFLKILNILNINDKLEEESKNKIISGFNYLFNTVTYSSKNNNNTITYNNFYNYRNCYKFKPNSIYQSLVSFVYFYYITRSDILIKYYEEYILPYMIENKITKYNYDSMIKRNYHTFIKTIPFSYGDIFDMVTLFKDRTSHINNKYHDYFINSILNISCKFSIKGE